MSQLVKNKNLIKSLYIPVIIGTGAGRDKWRALKTNN